MEKRKEVKPSTDDLRQMYVYNDYWKSGTWQMLLYPSNESFLDFVPYEENSSNLGHQNAE
jgi:5-methylcytosine-specific restriction enzyme subunit McrC